MRYRCSIRRTCGARKKLRKPIDQYARRPRCPACGQDTLKLDVAHYRRRRKLLCRCPGVPFPHERGTIIGCESYTGVFDEDDYRTHLDRLAKAGCGFA